ncbi:MAG: alpha-L-fucosidase [Spirochaetales bacterium]|nr:alpha-L-fucosidase [Spirochaetales bacterium]
MSNRTDWFVHDRFGLFIHWGLYALPARQEWVKSLEEIEDAEYDRKYFSRFEPDLYDPVQWARAAKHAGMKYFVITVKHHEGFCLWNSRFTEYKSMNTPVKKDLLTPMVKAFRDEGIKVGFYYSLIDWHHEDYIIDTHNHPRRNGDIESLNKGRDHNRYIEYLHNQVRELLTDFGKIDILWFDFSFPDKNDPLDLSKGKGKAAWKSEELYSMIRELQPDVILDDRLDLPGAWDVKTPEQFQPRSPYKVDGQPVVWEACQTFSNSWGYDRDVLNYRDSRQLIETLIDCVSKGGNLLLNVGPTGRGEFDYRALERLEDMGNWMRYNNRSIYGCAEAPPEYEKVENCLLTYNRDKNRLYIHILSWPYKHLHLDGRAYIEHVEYAQFLHDASEVPIKGLEPWQEHSALDAGFDSEKTLTLVLPLNSPPVEIPVIELFLK